MASKCKDIVKYTIIPLSILLISLSQLYFQYSSITTHRTENLDKKDKRNAVFTFNLLGGKYEFNYEKIKEIFDDNALMKINVLKNFTLKTFDNLNEKRDSKLDKKQYMLLYIIIYDFIYIIFLYSFFFKYYKAGIIKILMQILKCIFLCKRLQKTSPDIYLYEVILNHFDTNLGLRGFTLATPEGYEISELICNLVFILDIIWLIILIKEKNDNKYIYIDSEISKKKEVINDEQRVDYKESDGNGDIYKEEDKKFSNDNNIITKDNNSDNDNNENSNDENGDNNNNNKDEDDINNNDENIESNNNFKYRSYNENNDNDCNNREVNNSFEEDKKEENIKNEEGNEEEEMEDKKESIREEDDMNDNQETN